MIFRLKTVEGVPEDVELGIGLFQDVVSCCCTGVEGFRGGYFLVNRETGSTVTLTVWANGEALGEGIENLARRVESDEQAATTVARVNSHGVRFDTFELAHEIAPEAG